MKKFIAIIFLLLILFNISIADEDSKVDEEVLNQLDEEGKVKVIVTLKEEIEQDYGAFSVMENVEISDVKNDLGVETENEFSIVKGFSGEIDAIDLNRLINDDRVEKIEYDFPVKAFLIDSVPLINASVVHNLNFGNGNIKGFSQTICIIDTGVNYTHPDLGGCLGAGCKVVDGYDFVNNATNPMDDNGHGTHVAGIATANGTLIGVAPEANIVAIKSLNSVGDGESSDIVAGIDYCVNNATLFNIKVITMSLGGGSYSSACDDADGNTALTIAINNAVANNITVVAASGNSGSSSNIASPACITNTTAVGSVDKDDNISSFTDRNILLDLLAPGGNINSTNITDEYGIKSGTSMAAPHVAGAVVLLRQYYSDTNRDVSVSDMIQQLKDSGKRIFDSGSGLVFSRIDVYNALNDTVNPAVEINLTSNNIELNQQNVTIYASYYDVFLDSYNANISYPDGSLLSDFTESISLITDNLTQAGSYIITAWANDTNGNENLTTNNLQVIDTSGLSSSSFAFNSVNDNNYTDNSFVELNITIGSKYNLTNVTLSHNFTDWHENETISLSNVNETEVIFNSTFNEGVYLWNAEACDINNYCANSGNKTLYVDQSEPEINLISPGNSSTATSNPILFTFNVTDFGIVSCDLFLNDVTNQSNGGFSLNSNNQFIGLNLSNGNYNWSVGCLDNVGKIGYSNNWTFTMSCSNSYTQCGSWGSCVGEEKSRTCYDANACTSAAYTETQIFDSCSDDGGSSSGGSTSSGGSGTSSGGGGAAVTENTDESSFSFQAGAGDNKKLSIGKDVGISGLDIDFKNAVNGVQIDVEKQDEQPSTVSAAPNVYKYIKIDTNINEEDIGEAKIEFKVEKSWININAAGQSTNVFLSRYKNGWTKLETLTAGQDDLYQKYVAYTPGFSYFAISADKTVKILDRVTGKTVENEEEVAEKSEETEEEDTATNGTPSTSRFRLFTGAVTNVVTNVYSPYSLIILGVLVVILVLFLVLRFRRKIGRTKGISIKKDPKPITKRESKFRIFNLFKKKEQKKGKWHDLEKEEHTRNDKYVHDFEIKRDVSSIDIEKKEGFFKRLFSKKEKIEKKKEEKTSFMDKLKEKFKRNKELKEQMEIK